MSQSAQSPEPRPRDQTERNIGLSNKHTSKRNTVWDILTCICEDLHRRNVTMLAQGD